MADDPNPHRTDRLGLPAATKRLVVLGDPHGDLIALDLVLELEGRPGTAFVSAGDNIGYADAKVSSYLCRMLEERGIPSVYGNHEDWSRSGKLFLSPPGFPTQLTPEALAWCKSLPYRIRIEAEAAPHIRCHLVHTLPNWAYVNSESAETLAEQEQVHVTFCGHTHKPAIYRLERGKKTFVRRLDPTRTKPVEVRYRPGARFVVDAGSLARPARPRRGLCTDRGTYAVFDLEAELLQLKAIDKRERMRGLLERMIDSPS